jgi:hypothetical protein
VSVGPWDRDNHKTSSSFHFHYQRRPAGTNFMHHATTCTHPIAMRVRASGRRTPQSYTHPDDVIPHSPSLSALLCSWPAADDVTRHSHTVTVCSHRVQP